MPPFEYELIEKVEGGRLLFEIWRVTTYLKYREKRKVGHILQIGIDKREYITGDDRRITFNTVEEAFDYWKTKH